MRTCTKIVCFILLAALCLTLPISAAEVSDETAAKTALAELKGQTVISWSDFYQNVTGTTGTDKGVLTRVTGGEGDYSSYIQYQVQGITESSENSRVLIYDDSDGALGLEGSVAAGDALLMRLVIRAVDAEGKTRATSLEKGVGTTSKPCAAFTIPTEWTEFYVPMTSGGAVNYLTLRFGYYNQTVQIADFTLVNYGSDVSAADLPSGSWTADDTAVGNMRGGASVTTERFSDAMECSVGDTLRIDPAVTAADGDMLLLTLPVRGKNVCSKITVYWDFTGTDTEMTYYAPVQWSNICMPVKCDGSLNGIAVSVDTGCVQFGTASLENKGSATFEDLALKSGLWLLEEYEDIVLEEADGVKAQNEAFYTEQGISSGRTSDLVLSSDGNYVYSIGDGMLTVTDITDPASPVVKSKLTGMGDVAGTSTLGDTRQLCLLPGKGTGGADAVIFTCRSYGAFIFDMAAPENPVELARYDALEMATGLAVYGDYAFICSRFYGVEVVDVSDPADPTHLCTILNEGGEVQSCKVVDGILYAGEYNNNCVSIYDVTDPLNYKKLGVCSLNGRGDGMTVATVGDRTYLYAGTGHHSVSGLSTSTPLSNLSYGQGNGLDIFDVTDPTNPVWLSTSKTDGRFYNTSCDFWSAEYSYDAATGRSYAYLVSTYNGVYVFDVTDPTAPVRVAHIAMELLPDSANYGSYSLTSSSRAFIYNFDTTGSSPVKYGAAGAVAVKDGVLCIAGVSSDLYVLSFDKAFDMEAVSQDAEVTVSGDYYSFSAFESLPGYASAVVEGGQTYAVAELNGYIYVAAGSRGIQIYDKELNHLGSCQTSDICYDLYIQDGLMYTAEGRDGTAIYTVDGLTLTETWRHVSNIGQVTTVRPSVTGKFVCLHVGALTGQIVRVSDSTLVVSVKASSQMYHHNVTALVAGRYMGFWANSSSERWYDFGENDSLDTPVLVTDSSAGYTPRAAMTGGLTAYGDMALATGSGGYYLYDPNTVTAAELKALTMIKPVDASGSKVSIYGKATVAGSVMISCDRIYSRIYVTDISDINNPVLLKSFEGSVGNPDIAAVVGDTVYIPLGYMGVVKFTLEHQVHCLCTESFDGHSCSDIEWEAWGDSEDELTGLPTSGNYYLVSDITVTTTTMSGTTLNLCLNGHTVTAASGNRVFTINTDGEVNLTDCRGCGEVLGSSFTSAGAIVNLASSNDNVFALYGGTLRGTAENTINGGLIYSNGGTVNIHGGAVRDGVSLSTSSKTVRGGNIRVDGSGTLTITGGVISGGQNTGLTGDTCRGGNIYMGASTTLNISGGIIEGGVTSGENGGNIYVDSGSVVTITGGTVRGGSSAKRGGNFYINSSASKPSTVNMSGGSVEYDTALSAASMGGNFYINVAATMNLSGGTVKDGLAANGGNIYVNIKGLLNMTGGMVSGGNATSNGGNVYINAAADMTMTGGTVSDGYAKTRGGNVYLAYNADYEETYGRSESTLTMTGGKLTDGESAGNGGNLFVYYECTATIGQEASITGGTAGSHGGNICGNNSSGLYSVIYIYGGDIVSGGTAGGNGDNIYGTGYLYIDLMGQDLSGVHTTVSRFYGSDSATDSYDGSKAGKLTFGSSVTSAPMSNWKNASTLKRYMTITNEDGTYEFHRFYLGITKMNLRPAVTGVGYKAVFAGSDEVKAMLVSYGFNLWLTEENVVTASRDGADFESMQEVTLRLQNFDVENYGEAAVYGSVFMELSDGTVIESVTYSYTLRSMLELVAADISPYSSTQLTALKAMCEKYSDAMAEWDISGILNYTAA